MTARHVASIAIDQESLRRGGTTRTAVCVCGWRGPERGTIELAADDALLHERSEFAVQRRAEKLAEQRASEPDITPRMAEVLRALVRATKPLTGNQIGTACGLRGGYNERTKSVHTTHAGKVQGPAQRVIGALNALRKRGLIDFGRRPDGLSGTAYSLTSKGREFCRTWGL